MMKDMNAAGEVYVCNLNNKVLRTFSQGGDQIIRPQEEPSSGDMEGEDTGDSMGEAWLG